MRGIGKLAPDPLILTHGDAEHIGGAASIAATNSRTQFIDSPLSDRSPFRQRLQNELAARSIPRSIHQAGDTIRISETDTIEILYPPASLLESRSDNKAIIARLANPSARILFLSDSGPAAWESLGPAPADIAVVGRHHSGILPGAEFLQKNNIRVVIASAAGFPDNEPIDENWAAMLRERGIELFRMDESGAVQILASPSGFEIEGFLDGKKYTAPR
jgi:competence protein ComEC